MDGWGEYWGCEKVDGTGLAENTTEVPEGCRRDACEAVQTPEFVSVVEGCYKRACADDKYFDYNWELLKGMSRREPKFRTKVSKEYREMCKAEGVEIEPWTEDGTNYEYSAASVPVVPWKGGVLVGALLVFGGFFSGL
ncbi:hypothetical protein BJ508DRAFT_414321 [Ascobolus immersus RN42]|uniref:Uncharacterized protein n=1 Tax=Ascobolus immersus RN42 TaxID=1160509 RepID=A0A3N4I9B5_ASCIM|nr:hypothetical protein BJ508DRAFT_414321 [Ascobolus immersus RN42]